MGMSKQEYWGGLPFHFPGDLSNPGIKLRSPELQAVSILTELQGKHWVLLTISIVPGDPSLQEK